MNSTTKPTFTKIDLEIEKRNKVWDKSNRAQRAVLVAKDVLFRLNAKTFTAKTGAWLNFDSGHLSNECSVQKYIMTGEQCSGCAMGGLMMSVIGYRNQVTGADTYGYRITPAHSKFNLTEVFDDEQQTLIEQAFEGGFGSFKTGFDDGVLKDLALQVILDIRYMPAESYNSYKQLQKYINIKEHAVSDNDKRSVEFVQFVFRYKKNDTRLRVIMNNIIRNKGTFVF